jgi:chaperonin GroEL
LNKLRGTFTVLAVKAPGYGDAKKELLEDIAVTVGAKVITESVGLKFENAKLTDLGKARRVIATKDTTTIVDGKGKKSDIEKRINQLKKQREQLDSKYEKEKLDERIAKLSGGVAVIRVGAATETEMKYLKLKIEDAVNATKAAIEEGIVAGGGVALIRAAKEVWASTKMNYVSPEQELGYKIVIKALEAPLKQIAVNAGRDDGSSIVDKVKNPYESHEIKNDQPTAEARKKKENFGFNALKNDWEMDMIAAGIVDPVKVARLGVENACSAAAILLTTEAAIAEEPEKKEDSRAHGGAPEMDY